jgi:hypothetical protein
MTSGIKTSHSAIAESKNQIERNHTKKPNSTGINDRYMGLREIRKGPSVTI